MPNINEHTLNCNIIGNLLCPEYLQKARKQYQNNQISQDTLEEAEDQAITDLVRKEERIGLKIVTDGGFRRRWWHLDTFWGFNGIKKIQNQNGYRFPGPRVRSESAQVTGKISFNPQHPDVKAFQFLYDLTYDQIRKRNDAIARQNIPAPAQLYIELVKNRDNRRALNKYYPNLDDLIEDIGKAYHDLIIALYSVGCRDIKLDDRTRDIIFTSRFWPEIGKELQISESKLEQRLVLLNNTALNELPNDLNIFIYVCRSNNDLETKDSLLKEANEAS